MSTREQERNLKKEVGRVAAAAIAQAQAEVRQLVLQHRLLAAQMLEFEKTVATVRASRAADRAFNDGVQESQGRQLENLRARVIANAEDIAAGGRREAKLADNLRIEHARTVQFESMGLWRRLRWIFTGARPPFYDPVNDTLVDRSPQTAYPGDGV